MTTQAARRGTLQRVRRAPAFGIGRPGMSQTEHNGTLAAESAQTP
jgi:hypothetical protein